MARKYQLIIYIIASLVIAAIPVISWPLNWVETYFHEISHGLTALLTGGQIERIVIRLNGSGYCTHTGGWRELTTFAGYFGAVSAGTMMYLSARLLKKNAVIISATMIVLIALSGLLYARDIITIIILGTLIGLFYLSYSDKFSQYFNRTEEFIGIYVLLSALRSPFNLFDGRHIGDGAALADLTSIPEIFWVGLWMAFGIFALTMLWFIERERIESTNY